MAIENNYKIHDISGALSSGAEYIGSKRKGWLIYKYKDEMDHTILFKQGRIGTGENWAEKVTSELANLLDLPHAVYELAYLNEESCVISPNFLEENEELRLGNQLIEGFDVDRKYKNTQHTLTAILNALQKNKVQLPKGIHHHPILNQADDILIGYLCFDAWVVNTDRHAENWGMITRQDRVNILAPTFDHASSLGRNESDEKRMERLKTKDSGFSVKAYIQRPKLLPIYDQNGIALNTSELIRSCKKYNKKATDYWIDKIIEIMNNEQKVSLIFERIPENFISMPAKAFAMAILNESAKQLREIQHE